MARRWHQTTALLQAHDDSAEDFLDWPAAAIRTLRAMASASGDWLSTQAILTAGEALGEGLNYASARQGVRWLVAGNTREIRGEEEKLVYAEEVSRTSDLQRLTDTGRAWARVSFELAPQDSTPVLRRPAAIALKELLGRAEFAPFKMQGLRVMRVLARSWETGNSLNFDTPTIEAESEALDGYRLSYANARTGCRALLDHLADGSRRKWGTWREPVKGSVAVESVHLGRAYTALTPAGLDLGRQALELVPPLAGAASGDATEAPPPDPVTPLWKVLHDEGEVLVIAASAQDAIALFEQDAGAEAHRAVGVDTSAPMILPWTGRTAHVKKRRRR